MSAVNKVMSSYYRYIKYETSFCMWHLDHNKIGLILSRAKLA